MNSPHISFPSAHPELRLKRAAEKRAEGVQQSDLLQDEMRLAAAWDKLHRARALLEMEQGQLCQEREALDAARLELHQREEALAEREAAVAAAEQRLQAEQSRPKSLFGFTRAPFGIGKTGS